MVSQNLIEKSHDPLGACAAVVKLADVGIETAEGKEFASSLYEIESNATETENPHTIRR